MRKIRDAVARKNEILDVAAELFVLKGYDKTSTGDILEKTGIARGTLYYHFKSKEELLDALVDRIVDGLVLNIRETMSAVAKEPIAAQIAAFIQAMKVDSPIGAEVGQEIHKPHNALMHQKMQQGLLDSIIPLAAELFRKGTENGDLNTKCPNEVAEMLILYSSIVFDDLNDLDEGTKRDKIVGFIYNMERLLGMTEGSLSPLLEYL